MGHRATPRFEAWAAGRTGYPFVDAGMRQLRALGWMHNRVRMVVASFLVKDLHVRWQRGAAHFLDWLVDGDVSQNQLNWQWVAGTGRDAAPYFRVFNPVTQGEKFDPDGTYVRQWVPELRGIPGRAVHQPWKLGLEAPEDYPAADRRPRGRAQGRARRLPPRPRLAGSEPAQHRRVEAGQRGDPPAVQGEDEETRRRGGTRRTPAGTSRTPAARWRASRRARTGGPRPGCPRRSGRRAPGRRTRTASAASR